MLANWRRSILSLFRRSKRFKKTASEIASLAPGHGHCFATDRITIDGARVGYFYREQPTEKADSGWRFFAGDESQMYADDPSNIRIYDVNTIANYDPEIIPLLHEPVGSAFVRDVAKGHFVNDTPAPPSRE